MSRRPNPAADRAEQNRATLKNLVKLEGNKTCSDCKRNKRTPCTHCIHCTH
jgi:stromal membrane-associated protein